jgi:hypothetical protein
MLTDYIYLDHDERYKMAPLKHSILTEITQYNGDFSVDLRISSKVMVKLNYTGMVKELYVVCQFDGYIDGSLPNGEKQWNNYLVSVRRIDGNGNVTYSDVNPISTIQIDYNGRLRESAKDALYYNCVQRLSHNTISAYDGINVYSFAIMPQLLQPSGAANFGKIGEVELIITFRQDVVNIISNTKKMLRIGVYAKQSNYLHVMRGLAGLAYYI